MERVVVGYVLAQNEAGEIVTARSVCRFTQEYLGGTNVPAKCSCLYEGKPPLPAHDAESGSALKFRARLSLQVFGR